MTFLTAEWRNLAIVNYEIDKSILADYLPYGTELDLWNGRCYLSLVGFMFLNTKLLGIKMPYHVNFEEVNLRFYVKRFVHNEWRRGVVFIKEIVPRPALTFVANTFYYENYETMPMRHAWNENNTSKQIEYSWKRNSNWQTIKVIAEKKAIEIERESETEFITEHYWGYAKVNERLTNEYEVTHPRWLTYEVTDHEILVNFEQTYSQKFGFLNNQQPVSVMLAEGSMITVENKTKLRQSNAP